MKYTIENRTFRQGGNHFILFWNKRSPIIYRVEIGPNDCAACGKDVAPVRGFSWGSEGDLPKYVLRNLKR